MNSLECSWLTKKNNSTYSLDSKGLPKIYTPSNFLRVKMRQEKAKGDMKKLMTAFYPEISLPENIAAAHYLVEPIHKSSLSIKTFTMSKGKTSAHTVLLPIESKSKEMPRKLSKEKQKIFENISETENESDQLASLTMNSPKLPLKSQFLHKKQKSKGNNQEDLLTKNQSTQKRNPIKIFLEREIGIPERISLKEKKDNKFTTNFKKSRLRCKSIESQINAARLKTSESLSHSTSNNQNRAYSGYSQTLSKMKFTPHSKLNLLSRIKR